VTRRRETYRPGQLQLVLIILLSVNMRVPESQAGRFYTGDVLKVLSVSETKLGA